MHPALLRGTETQGTLHQAGTLPSQLKCPRRQLLTFNGCLLFRHGQEACGDSPQVHNRDKWLPRNGQQQLPENIRRNSQHSHFRLQSPCNTAHLARTGQSLFPLQPRQLLPTGPQPAAGFCLGRMGIGAGARIPGMPNSCPPKYKPGIHRQEPAKHPNTYCSGNYNHNLYRLFLFVLHYRRVVKHIVFSLSPFHRNHSSQMHFPTTRPFFLKGTKKFPQRTIRSI